MAQWIPVTNRQAGVLEDSWSMILYMIGNYTQAQPLKRGFPLVTYLFIVLCAFTIAGVFSLRISTSLENQVLLSGQNCGIMTHSAGWDQKPYWDTFSPYLQLRISTTQIGKFLLYSRTWRKSGQRELPGKSFRSSGSKANRISVFLAPSYRLHATQSSIEPKILETL